MSLGLRSDIAGVHEMAEESRLQRIAPEELPNLLTQLHDRQATELILIGPEVELFTLLGDWPDEFQGCTVYQLSSVLSELPHELLRLYWLQSLTLWSLDLNDADATAIAEHLNQLTSLDLSINKVTDRGAQVISRCLHQLTSLDLGNRIETSALNWYSSYPNNEITVTGAQTIAEHLGKLSSLKLDNNRIENSGAQAIAEHLSQLTSLDLSNNQIDEIGAQAIAEHLSQLTSLDLSNNQID
ncbi:hypothetical protein C7271_21755, partial [filamentous cyanobacterium CCP5]